MSNETKEVNMTATENENNEAITSNELNELREINANLIAEREALTKKNEDLQAKLESEHESNSRLRNYWRQEEEKVSTLKQIVRSIPINGYITAKELLDAMVENL